MLNKRHVTLSGSQPCDFPSEHSGLDLVHQRACFCCIHCLVRNLWGSQKHACFCTGILGRPHLCHLSQNESFLFFSSCAVLLGVDHFTFLYCIQTPGFAQDPILVESTLTANSFDIHVMISSNDSVPYPACTYTSLCGRPCSNPCKFHFE